MLKVMYFFEQNGNRAIDSNFYINYKVLFTGAEYMYNKLRCTAGMPAESQYYM